jgi:hypothetical protein
MKLWQCLTSKNAQLHSKRRSLQRLFFALFFPMLGDPKRWFDEPESSIALAGQGIGRIALTMKNHNACIAWNLRGRPIVAGPSWNAVVFETWTPLSRPVSQMA